VYTDPKNVAIPACPDISRYKSYILQARNGQDLPKKLIIQKVLQEIMVDAEGKLLEVQDIFDWLEKASNSEFNTQDIQEQIDLFKQAGYIYEPKKGRIALITGEEKVMPND
jgi:hypothetical protein